MPTIGNMPTNQPLQHSLPDNVVLFGASGFIGKNLLRALRDKINRIFAVTLRPFEEHGVECIQMADLGQLALRGETVVVHLAAHRYDAAAFSVAQSEILQRNATIAAQVFDFCVRHEIKELRMASSIAVYDGQATDLDDAKPLDLGHDPADSELMYGWSKRWAEICAGLYRQKYDIHTIAFRLSNPYGPFDSLVEEKAHVMPAFIIRALTSDGPFQVRGNPQATRDFIFVDDVRMIFERSLTLRGVDAIYNLGSGVNTTILHLAHAVLKEVGSEREVVVQGKATSNVVHRACRIERLRRDFDVNGFIPLEDGLQKTINWYRDALQQ